MGILPTGFLRRPPRLPLIGTRLSVAMKKARRTAGPLHPDFLEPQYRALGRFFLDDRIVLGLRLRTATRSLGERSLDFLDRFGLGDPLHG